MALMQYRKQVRRAKIPLRLVNYILPAAYSLNIHVGDLLLSEIITFSSLLA